MIEIIPAILPRSREDVEVMVQRYIDTPIQTIQIDLVDGSFASPKTWPYISKQQYQEHKILEEEGFPGWQDIDIELDLMISQPLESLPKFIEWGPSRIIIHASSIDPKEYVTFLEAHRSIQSFIHFGIAFAVDDDISYYKELLEYVDFVQCMGIATIGSQGKNFDDRVLIQIEKVLKLAPQMIISVDGGVNPETAHVLVQAGVTRLVSGSYMAKSIDINEAIQSLSHSQVE